MNKKLFFIIIGIPLVIGTYFFSQWYGDFNRNTTEEYRFLNFAIYTGIIALGLHFLKEWKYMKNNLIMLYLLNSYELLLLIVTPILSTFQVFIKEFPQHMIILLFTGVFVWWIITLIRTNNTSGKFALVMSIHTYAGFIVILGLFGWLITLPK